MIPNLIQLKTPIIYLILCKVTWKIYVGSTVTQPLLGYKHSAETVAKVKKARALQEVTPGMLAALAATRDRHVVPIVKIDPANWTVVDRYVHSREAAVAHGLHQSTVLGAAKRGYKVGGFYWMTRADYDADGVEALKAQADRPLRLKRNHPLRQFSLDGQPIKIWDRFVDITNELGFPNSNVRKSIERGQVAYGFRWRYMTDQSTIDGIITRHRAEYEKIVANGGIMTHAQ